MNAKKFSDAMSELDTKYVDEALNYKKKAKKPIWVKWGAIAACLCLMIPLTAFAVDIIQYNRGLFLGGCVAVVNQSSHALNAPFLSCTRGSSIGSCGSCACSCCSFHCLRFFCI